MYFESSILAFECCVFAQSFLEKATQFAPLNVNLLYTEYNIQQYSG